MFCRGNRAGIARIPQPIRRTTQIETLGSARLPPPLFPPCAFVQILVLNRSTRRQGNRILRGLKIRSLLVALLAVFALAVPSHADFKDHVRAGAAYLKKGEFEQARAEYESAQIDEPESPIIPYNIAATYYAQGKMEEDRREIGKCH